MFQPRFVKHAKLLYKGVTRFLHYKKDLLPPDKLDEILGLRAELAGAIKERNKERIDDLSKTINRTCEKVMPEARSSELSENIEVFFVSIVIALGIRTYIAQPFQIPTSSMQPTLSGINARPTEEDPRPGIIGSFLGFFTGTTYLNAVSDHSGLIDPTNGITQHQFFIFRPYSKVHFTDGHTITIKSPKDHLEGELGFWSNLDQEIERRAASNPDMRDEVRVRSGRPVRVEKGQLLARGIVTNGDHVIVNKFIYHFRRPTRGEVFVFTTKNISGIENERNPDGSLRFNPQWGSQHYIKRLVGVPGDTLDLQPPDLIINGEPAKEAGIRRVVDERIPLLPGERTTTYHGYSPMHNIPLPTKLSDSPRREYFAMGDNSYRSSDSRYWGSVPEQNLVGPGWFCYWPITKHWGRIR
jgi:signal peptidase I